MKALAIAVLLACAGVYACAYHAPSSANLPDKQPVVVSDSSQPDEPQPINVSTIPAYENEPPRDHDMNAESCATCGSDDREVPGSVPLYE